MYDDSSLQAVSQLKSVGLVWGSAAALCYSDEPQNIVKSLEFPSRFSDWHINPQIFHASFAEAPLRCISQKMFGLWMNYQFMTL